MHINEEIRDEVENIIEGLFELCEDRDIPVVLFSMIVFIAEMAQDVEASKEDFIKCMLADFSQAYDAFTTTKGDVQ